MATTKTAEVLLKYKVDASSANRVSDSFEDLIAEINDLNAELTKIGRASSTGVSGITRELPKAESGIVALQDEVIRLRKELLSLDNVNVTPTVTVEGAGGAGGVGALNAVDRFGTIGSQVASGLGNGMVGQAAGLIGDVAGAVATMNPFLIAGAVAIGGVSLAMQDLAERADRARIAQEAIYAGQSAAEELSLIEQIARRAEIIRQVADIERQIARYNEDIAAADKLFELARERGNTAVGGAGVNLVQLGNELQAQQAVAQGLIDGLSTDLTALSSEFVTISSNLSHGAEAAVRFVNALSQIPSSFQGVVDGFNAMADKARSLPAELAAAGAAEAARKEAEAAEATAARSAQALKLKNSVIETAKAQEALVTAQNAYNDAVEASRQKITDLNDKLQSDIAAAVDERRAALLEAERDAGEQRVKIAEDNAKELARIQRRFDRSYAQAVGDRDALAAARAEQQKEDELKDLGERYKDQTKALDDNLKNQQRIIEQRYEAQVRTARSAAEAAIRLEQQRAQAEINVKAQSVQAALNALVSAQTAENSIRANFYNQSITQAVYWANQMHYLMAYGFTIPGGTTTTKQPGTFPGKAIGGPVNAGMPYVVGERGPEMFVPNVNGTIMPNRGGAMFSVNFEGATGGTIRATSKAQAIAVLDKVLTGMGAA